MKRPILFLFGLVAIILFLSVVQVGISNRLSTTGIELAAVQQKIKQYRIENELLTEKLLTKTSYTQIADKAITEGFVDSKTTVYLSTPVPIAVSR